MKKAIHLLNSLKHGGAENVALNYSVVLKKIEVSSCIIAGSESEDFERQIKKQKIDVCHKLTVGRLIDSDYIFIHSNQKLLHILKYYRKLKSSKSKIIYIQHLNYSKNKFRLLAFIINFICTDFIQITPMTSFLVDKYIKIKKHLIINFYITKHNSTEHADIRAETRKSYGIAAMQTVYMFSGIFRKGKGVEDFLKIATHFKSDENRVFLIVGDGEESNLVRNYLHDNIRWTGFQNDVERFLIASDVYLFLSKFEMLPMALMEAINTGKKILAYPLEINNYLLNNKTCASVNEMISCIETGEEPNGFKKYDEEYALSVLKKL